MNRTHFTGWKTINSVLGKSLAKPDFEKTEPINWLNFQWKILVGKDLTPITQVKKLSTKTLFVAVSDKKWFPAIAPLREKIIVEINRLAGSNLVSRIVLEEGLITNQLIEKSSSATVIHYSMKQNKTNENEFMINSENLRDILNRISDKIRLLPMAGIILFVSNCATLPSDRSSSTISLSNSHAVKIVEKLSKKQTENSIGHPRAYYHYLIALKAVRDHRFEEAAQNFRQIIKFDSKDSKIHQQLAVNLIRSGKMSDAHEALKQSLSQFPDNPELNMMFGDVLSARKEYVEALDYYQNVIQVESTSPRAYLLRGTIYEHLKQYDFAKNMYEQTIQVESANPLGHYYLARMNILFGELKEAKNHLVIALELRPNLLQPRELLAWIWEKEGNEDEAKREYKILLKLDPLNKKIHERMNSMNGSIEHIDPSSEEYRLVVEDLLGAPQIHMKIGAIYYEQGIYLKALDEFQLIKTKKQTKEILMLLGRVYEIIGRVDKAIEEMSVLKKTEPKLINLMIYLARLYSINEQPKEAIRLISEAVEIEKGNDTLHRSLSLAYISVGQYDQAIKEMQKAISINKNEDLYYFELGALFERTGKFELAIKHIKRSIELNPMHSNAHNFLGYMYAIQGKSLDKALGHLQTALSIQPKNGYFLDSLSWIYFKKGESQRALDELKKAMVYTSPDPVLYSHLGDIHFSLENYLEAGKAWKTSLFLTLEKSNDSESELPNPKDLKTKILKAQKLLNRK